MKNIFKLFMVTMLLVLSSNYIKAQTYCTTGMYTTGCSDNDYFSAFNFGTINQTGLTCLTGAQGYSDYTSTSVTFIPGNTYSIGGTTVYGSDEDVEVWIDFNDDGTFDNTTEMVYSNLTGFGSFTGNVTIPVSATPGTHRMRVRLEFAASTTFDACSSVTFGNVNDYTAIITPLSSPYFVVSPASNNFNCLSASLKLINYHI